MINNRYDEFGSEFNFKAESYIKSSKGEENNQDNPVFQRKKEEPRKNADKVVFNVGGSKLVNKELTNNEDSNNIKSKEYNKDTILFDKDKSSKNVRQKTRTMIV